MNEALSIFLQKTGYPIGFKPNYQSFAAILKSFAATADTKSGKSLHTHIILLGHASCHLVSKALLNMYAKCNVLDDCKKLFDQIPNRDTITWNIMLSGFALSRNHDTEVMRLFHEMRFGCDSKPSSVTIATVLPICARSGALNLGKSVHCYVIKYGLESNTLVGNALVSLYAKSGNVYEDAYNVFEGIPEKDVVSWNAMMAGFAENNFMDEAFETFTWMLKGPTAPNYATIANILPVCGLLDKEVGYHFGKEIHCYALRRAELVADLSVVNALVRFYTRIGRMGEAESMFQRMRVRDLVSWNTIISGYTSNSEWLKALELFHEFLSVERVELDSVTLFSILPACANLCQLLLGKQIHGYVIRHPELNEDTPVGNALLSFYAKCGDIEAALRTFSSIGRRDLISWNSMLDAFAERNLQSQFFELLHWMLEESTKPHSVTILAITRFCATLSRVDKVKEAHGVSLRSGFLLGNGTPTLGNVVIDAYAKCGNMEYASKIFEKSLGKRNVVTCNSIISGYVSSGSTDDAHRIFHNMLERDLTTWNLLVRAYAKNNCPSQALSLFHELKAYGMKPNALTLMSLLPICAKMASVQLLRQCHGYAVRACFKDVHLNAALIDVYSKCGNIDSAYKLFQSTHRKDVVVFTAMVGGYAMHGKGEEALGVFSHMLELGEKPDHVTIISVLSACSHTGLINEGLKIFYSLEKMHGIKPTNEQYACVVDLLARGGRIKDAYSFATKMPFEANANVWGSLLGASRAHHQVEMGRHASNRLFEMETNDIGNYVVLSNLYAADNQWDGVLGVRRLMRTRYLKKPVGCSWIEVEKRKNVFMAGDCCHPERSIIYSTLSILDQQIKEPFQF